ncbi:MAG: MFS transporter [Hyphomicrobiales bacterium]
MKEKLSIQAWISFGITSIFSLMQFFLQVSTDLMAKDLMQSFHIEEGKVGLLTSAFFWAYLAVQIPAGLLIDKFRLRNVLIAASAFLAIGCLLFALSGNYSLALASRFIMGLGAGFGFIGMLSAIGEWFPAKIFPLMLGIGELVGMVGTSAGQVIAPHFVIDNGWRSLMILLAIVTAIISLSMIFFLKNKGNSNGNNHITISNLKNYLSSIAKKKSIWAAGLFACGGFSIITVFVDVWGVPFLENVYGYSYLQSTSCMAYILAGVAIGGPILGWIGGKTGQIRRTMGIGGFTSLVLLILILTHLDIEIHIFRIMFFLIGMGCSAYLLPFTLVGQNIEGDQKGTGIAFANTLSLVGAILLQPIIGTVIASMNDTSSNYDAYTTAIWILPLFIFIAMLSVFWTKEKKHI